MEAPVPDQGFAGLKDLSPIHKSHPQTTPLETVERLKELALEPPAYGCNRLEAMLSLEDQRVSSITIQKIVNDNEPGTRQDRRPALELTAEQATFLEKLNPCFRERHVKSLALGELLSGDTSGTETKDEVYAHESLAVDLANTVYALDSTTIDLCLSLFPWAPFRQTKAAVKLHTLLDLRGAIPAFIFISDGKLHDVHVLDVLLPEPGAFYVMDRGYLDFQRLHVLHGAGAFFVTRAKSNLRCKRIYSSPVDRTTGLICDQQVRLTVVDSRRAYPERLRRIRFKDPDSGKTLVFLTNHFAIPALSVCALYKSRWQVELFFKWIKQHLRIKRFFGTSENAVKSQIWTARRRLRARCYHQETSPSRSLFARHATDPQRHPFRKSAVDSVTYRYARAARKPRKP